MSDVASDVASDVIAIIAKKKRVEKPTVEVSDRLEDLGLESLERRGNDFRSRRKIRHPDPL